ncbi:MAG: tetratricopeptide repeat protein [Candidatus Aminicenantes bacterium]|nr:MAG: tetratricopeptide repeat protein [Candidatus Aminicenantes bacterium]
MKRIIPVLVLTLSLCLSGLSYQAASQEDKPMYMNFDKISIWGHVYNEGQLPLAGIKVEIRLAYDSQRKQPEIMGASDIQSHVWDFLYKSLGSDVFAWAESNEEGLYRINGIPRPGAYYLQVRHAEDYLQTKVHVIIDKTGAKEFEADVILRARKSAVPPVSKEALEEIAKAKEANAANDTDEAIEHLKKAIEIEPEFAEAYYNLGILLRVKREIDDAIAYFIKAVEYKENYGLALFALGETLHAKKKYAQSNPYLVKYLEVAGEEKNGTKAQAHYLAGTNYLNLKKAKRAIIHLSKAIELKPGINPNAYIFLANSCVMARDGENAIKNYKKYMELYPDAPNIEQVKTILEKLKSMYPEEKKKLS